MLSQFILSLSIDVKSAQNETVCALDARNVHRGAGAEDSSRGRAARVQLLYGHLGQSRHHQPRSGHPALDA